MIQIFTLRSILSFLTSDPLACENAALIQMINDDVVGRNNQYLNQGQALADNVFSFTSK